MLLHIPIARYPDTIDNNYTYSYSTHTPIAHKLILYTITNDYDSIRPDSLRLDSIQTNRRRFYTTHNLISHTIAHISIILIPIEHNAIAHIFIAHIPLAHIFISHVPVTQPNWRSFPKGETSILSAILQKMLYIEVLSPDIANMGQSDIQRRVLPDKNRILGLDSAHCIDERRCAQSDKKCVMFPLLYT